jgi:hypothetical protein
MGYSKEGLQVVSATAAGCLVGKSGTLGDKGGGVCRDLMLAVAMMLLFRDLDGYSDEIGQCILVSDCWLLGELVGFCDDTSR